MKIFNINNVKYAAELEWKSLHKSEFKKNFDAEQETFRTNNNLDTKTVIFGAVFPANDKQLIGLTGDKDLKGSIALARVILDLELEGEYESYIYIDKLEEDEFWACIINDGEIVAVGDFVGTSDEVISHIQMFLSENGADHFALCFPEEHQDLFGYEFSLEIQNVPSLEEILDSSNKPVKAYSDARIKSLKKLSPVTLGCVALVLAAGGLMFHVVTTSNQGVIIDDIEWEVPKIEPQKPKVDRTQQIELLLEKAYQEEVHWLKQDFMKQDPSKVLDALIKLDHEVPDYIGGWRVTSIAYDGSRNNNAVINLKREAFGTPVTLENSISNAEIGFTNGGQNAHLIVDIDNISRSGNIQNIIGFLEVENSSYGQKEFMHDAHLSGVAWSVDAQESTERPVEISGISDRGLSKQRQLKLNLEAVTLSDNGIESLRRSGLILDNAKTFLLNKINISRLENQAWILEGTIHEKQ